jgi:hypothetical protein
MDRALFAAASGMAAQQRNLDTIADNLRPLRSRHRRPGLLRGRRRARAARLHARRAVLARGRRHAAQCARLPARGSSNSRRRALRERRRERHRTRGLSRRFAHDRAYRNSAVSVSRSPARDRRGDLRGDAGSRQDRNGRRGLTRRSENSLWHARRVERHDRRRDDADPDRAARVRGKR